MVGLGHSLWNDGPILLVMSVIVAVFAVMWSYRKIRQWNINNHSACSTVRATVLKLEKTGITGYPLPQNHNPNTPALYYVTFCTDSGKRMKFKVSGAVFAKLNKDATGQLTHQGTRYVDFELEV